MTMDENYKLRQLAQQIRNASQTGENTAEKVGKVLTGILDLQEKETSDIRNFIRKDRIDSTEHHLFLNAGITVEGLDVGEKLRLWEEVEDETGEKYIKTTRKLYSGDELLLTRHAMYELLGRESDEQIHLSHLKDALAEYVTESMVDKTYITLDKDQVITGRKTFSSDILLNPEGGIIRGQEGLVVVNSGDHFNAFGNSLKRNHLYSDDSDLYHFKAGTPHSIWDSSNSNLNSVDWNARDLYLSNLIYMNGKEAVRASDEWLRLNNYNHFQNGIYCGNSLLRTDGKVEVGGNGSAFYANNSGQVYAAGQFLAGTGHESDLGLNYRYFAGYGKTGNSYFNFGYNQHAGNSTEFIFSYTDHSSENNYTSIGFAGENTMKLYFNRGANAAYINDHLILNTGNFAGNYWKPYLGDINLEDIPFRFSGSYNVINDKPDWSGAVYGFGSSGSSTSLVLRTPGATSTSIFFRRSIDNNRWDGDWREFWHAGNSNNSSAHWTANVLTANRIVCGYDSGVYGSVNVSDWVRLSGTGNGILWEHFGGGIYMTDNTYVRTYNGNAFYSSSEMDSDGSGNAAICTAGGIWSNKTIWTGGNILANGAITAKATSDRRLKTNFRDIDANQLLLSMGNIRSFDYRDKAKDFNPNTPDSGIGLTYQQAIKVLPGMSAKQKGDKYGSLNYLNTDYINLIGAATQQTHERFNQFETKVEKELRMVKRELTQVKNELKKYK